MPLKLQNLSVLKLKMMHEKDIIVAYNYFFDHFGENGAFITRSNPARNPLLEAVLGQVVGGLLGLTGAGASAMKLIMLTIPDHSFYHGTGVIGGHVVTFIYFDDIQLGCAAVAARRGRPTTRLVRFSTMSSPTTPRAPVPN